MTTPHIIDQKIAKAKKASSSLLDLSAKQRTTVLKDLATHLKKNERVILQANEKDIKNAHAHDVNESFIERLALDHKKILGMHNATKHVAIAPDVLYELLEKSTQPSGITIQKKRYPLGVISIVYESRPNVTVDAFAMAFKSGNAVILKGGKEIYHTNKAIVTIIRSILKKHSINSHIIQDLSAIPREHMLHILSDERIDCLIPRGGKGLIDFVKKHATIPIIITGASVVHTYVDNEADIDLAVNVILNAKTRRVSICNALDTVLLHRDIYKDFLSRFISALHDIELNIHADTPTHTYLTKLSYPHLTRATAEDFDTEFLDMILAIKTVNSLDDAIAHIHKHSLGHSEAIITQNTKHVQKFFQQIDAACLYHNTSTQFSDGGEFGMGGEIGISTQKLHARGPFAYKELTTYKYLITSRGSIRA